MSLAAGFQESRQVAYVAKASDGWRVIVGEHRSPACDEIARLAWTADGTGVWYGMRSRRELCDTLRR